MLLSGVCWKRDSRHIRGLAVYFGRKRIRRRSLQTRRDQREGWVK